jgi:calcineurin-like phosphoesterase family protein
MRNHFLTSDPHLNHGNILKYCRRVIWLNPDEKEMLVNGTDFKVSPESIRAMNDGLIENINKTVGVDDVLWMLGDFLFAHDKYYISDAWRFRNRIKCKTVHMCWGNHDRQGLEQCFTSDHELARVAISEDGNYTIAERGRKWGNGTIKLILSHGMQAIWDLSHRGAINLYGHSHSGAELGADKAMPGRRSMDVGVDNAFKLLGQYRPFSLAEVLEFMRKRQGWKIDHH